MLVSALYFLYQDKTHSNSCMKKIEKGKQTTLREFIEQKQQPWADVLAAKSPFLPRNRAPYQNTRIPNTTRPPPSHQLHYHHISCFMIHVTHAPPDVHVQNFCALFVYVFAAGAGSSWNPADLSKRTKWCKYTQIHIANRTRAWAQQDFVFSSVSWQRAVTSGTRTRGQGLGIFCVLFSL